MSKESLPGALLGATLLLLAATTSASEALRADLVLVKKAEPLQFLAIVHDIDREPTWREDWIASAINGVIEEAEWRRLESVAVPLIGTRHGNVEMRRVALWLGSCLSRTTFRYLKRIWVIAPTGSETELMWALRTEFGRKR